MPRARPKLEISTVAPCSWATLATAKPIELSMVTPVTRMRLPARIPPPAPVVAMSVPHSESAVDRDDRSGDVASIVRGEPRDGVRDLGCRTHPAQRDLLPVRRLLLVRQHRGHVGLDEAGCDDVRGDGPAPELARDRPRHPDQPGLRRGVVHLAGRAEKPDDAGDEDD